MGMQRFHHHINLQDCMAVGGGLIQAPSKHTKSILERRTFTDQEVKTPREREAWRQDRKVSMRKRY